MAIENLLIKLQTLLRTNLKVKSTRKLNILKNGFIK